MSDEIPISAVTPSSLETSHSIRGVITLVWPYSRSTHTCAILLAAKDFRLRTKRGQVRVTFSGEAAKAIVESKAGISDSIVLSLRGAKWQERLIIRTPGSSIDGELAYDGDLNLQVIQSNGVTRDISIAAARPEVGEKDAADKEDVTTHAKGNIVPQTPVHSHQPRKHTFESPAFLHNLQSNKSLSHDPFFDAEDLDQPRKRFRISFGDVREWHYARSDASSVDEELSSQGDGADLQGNRTVLLPGVFGPTTTTTTTESTAHRPIVQPSPLVAEGSLPRATSPTTTLPQSHMQDTSQAAYHDETQKQAPSTPALHSDSAAALPLPPPSQNTWSTTQSTTWDASLTVQPVQEEEGEASTSTVDRVQQGDVITAQSELVENHQYTTQAGGNPSTTPPQPTHDGALSLQDTDLDLGSHGTGLVPGTRYESDISHDAYRRAQSHDNTLSSLFGFSTHYTISEEPARAVKVLGGHGRTLSDFEVAESHAMEQLLPAEGQSANDSDAAALLNPAVEGMIMPP